MERSAKSYYFTLFFDSLFTLIASFIFSLYVFAFFVEYPYTIIIAIVFSLLTTLLIIKKDLRKAKNEGINILDNKRYNSLMITLNFYSQEKILNLTKQLLEKRAKKQKK